jgi:hypothetical protein
MMSESIPQCLIDFLQDYGLPLTAQYITITDPDTTEYSNETDVSQNRYGKQTFSCCEFGTRLLYRLWKHQDEFMAGPSENMTTTTDLERGKIYFFTLETNHEMHFFVLYYPLQGQPLYLGTYGGNNVFYIKPIRVDDINNLWDPRLAPSTYMRLFDIPRKYRDRANYQNLNVTYQEIPLRPLTLDDILDLLQDLSTKAIHPNNRQEIDEMIKGVQQCPN